MRKESLGNSHGELIVSLNIFETYTAVASNIMGMTASHEGQKKNRLRAKL